MFLYLPIESERASPYIGSYHTFGLQVRKVFDNMDKEVICLPDISTDASFVPHLADIFSREQLDPIHLSDVIEDLL